MTKTWNARPPQFGLNQMLVYLSVPALAVALYTVWTRRDVSVVYSGFAFSVFLLACVIAVACSKRNHALAECGQIVARLRLSYWPIPLRRQLKMLGCGSFIVGMVIALSDRVFTSLLIIGCVFAVLALVDLALAACWRMDVRDALICDNGIVVRGYEYYPWDDLRSTRLHQDQSRTTFELIFPSLSLLPMECHITLIIPADTPHSVTEFLEQKTDERIGSRRKAVR